MKSKDQQLLEEAYNEVSFNKLEPEQLNELNLSKLNPFAKKQPPAAPQQPPMNNQNKGDQQAFAVAFDEASKKISEVFKEHQMANSPLFADLWKTLMAWRQNKIH